MTVSFQMNTLKYFTNVQKSKFLVSIFQAFSNILYDYMGWRFPLKISSCPFAISSFEHSSGYNFSIIKY